jgi:hypothetical protein
MQLWVSGKGKITIQLVEGEETIEIQQLDGFIVIPLPNQLSGLSLDELMKRIKVEGDLKVEVKKDLI